MKLEEVNNSIKNEMGVVLYFLGEECNVCHALRPKIKELFDNKFPKIKQVYIDAKKNPQISAHFSVFSVPTLIVFLDTKAFIKEGRSVSLYQLEEKLTRPYEMLLS